MTMTFWFIRLSFDSVFFILSFSNIEINQYLDKFFHAYYEQFALIKKLLIKKILCSTCSIILNTDTGVCTNI